MGVVDSIAIDKFPVQSTHLHERVQVCFNYNTYKTIGGTIVRDDTQDPYKAIIRLDDGRYVLATECQYSYSPIPF